MTGRITQICYTTRDIEATARSLVEIDRIGPFFLAEFPLHDLHYQGRPYQHPMLKVAFAYVGTLQVELIQSGGGEETFYGANLAGRREGFHHSYVSSDEPYDAIVARYAAAGEPLIYHGLAGEDRVRFGFIDARPRLGHFVEVLETNPPGPNAHIMATFYARMEEAALAWDGARTLRSMAELM